MPPRKSVRNQVKEGKKAWNPSAEDKPDSDSDEAVERKKLRENNPENAKSTKTKLSTEEKHTRKAAKRAPEASPPIEISPTKRSTRSRSRSISRVAGQSSAALNQSLHRHNTRSRSRSLSPETFLRQHPDYKVPNYAEGKLNHVFKARARSSRKNSDNLPHNIHSASPKSKTSAFFKAKAKASVAARKLQQQELEAAEVAQERIEEPQETQPILSQPARTRKAKEPTEKEDPAVQQSPAAKAKKPRRTKQHSEEMTHLELPPPVEANEIPAGKSKSKGRSTRSAAVVMDEEKERSAAGRAKRPRTTKKSLEIAENHEIEGEERGEEEKPTKKVKSKGKTKVTSPAVAAVRLQRAKKGSIEANTAVEEPEISPELEATNGEGEADDDFSEDIGAGKSEEEAAIEATSSSSTDSEEEKFFAGRKSSTLQPFEASEALKPVKTARRSAIPVESSAEEENSAVEEIGLGISRAAAKEEHKLASSIGSTLRNQAKERRKKLVAGRQAAALGREKPTKLEGGLDEETLLRAAEESKEAAPQKEILARKSRKIEDFEEILADLPENKRAKAAVVVEK
jgi:hypothetical protein